MYNVPTFSIYTDIQKFHIFCFIICILKLTYCEFTYSLLNILVQNNFNGHITYVYSICSYAKEIYICKVLCDESKVYNNSSYKKVPSECIWPFLFWLKECHII